MRNLKLLITFVATFCMLLFTFNSSAQGIGINATGAAPDKSALLDLSSTDKGFLITRADTANITSPAFGLMTLAPSDSCLYMYGGASCTGAVWISLGGVGKNCRGISGCGSPFTDARGGKTYGTVQIGNQCWMSENLAYLPSVVGSNTGSATTAYYYVYGYNGTNVTTAKSQSNYTTYGVLYNWTAAMSGSSSSSSNPSGVQGVCPSGWHLPSDAEWKELELALGMSCPEVNNTGWRGDEGDKLKTSSWGGNNSSGFTALPGGNQGTNGLFNFGASIGYWWSATESGTDAWLRFLYSSLSGVYRDTNNKSFAFSVRCVRN